MDEASSLNATANNAVKVAAEALVVPGGSLILEGDLKGGATHAVGALLAKALIGPVGWFLIAANSYSNSVSGKHLHEHFGAGGEKAS